MSAMLRAASSASINARSPVHGPALSLPKFATQRFRQVGPLAGTGARAMQGYHPPAARRPRGVGYIDVHWIMPACLNGSVIAAERAIACMLTHDRALDLRAREPDVFELTVADRLQMSERRLPRTPSYEGGQEALRRHRQHAKYVAAGAALARRRVRDRAHDRLRYDLPCGS